MAEKAEILEEIKTLAERKLITKDELLAAFDAAQSVKPEAAPEITQKQSGLIGIAGRLADILYYIGGGIVFLGIVVLVAQNWTRLGFAPKVLATLGAGIAAYYTGLMFSRDERTRTVAPAFFLISALVAPLGLYVVIDNAGLKTDGYGYQTIISGILLVVYSLSHLVFRKLIFVLFSILYGTWFFFSITSYLLTSGSNSDEWKFYIYRALVAGLAYLLLSRSLADSQYASLTGFLNHVGIFGFLSAALELGGSRPYQNWFWVLIYPGLVFGAIFISIRIKSKAFLVWGTFFLMAYLLKLTSEYFSQGLGWPLALVLAGLTLIGVGYMSISIKRKYLSV